MAAAGPAGGSGSGRGPRLDNDQMPVLLIVLGVLTQPPPAGDSSTTCMALESSFNSLRLVCKASDELLRGGVKQISATSDLGEAHPLVGRPLQPARFPNLSALNMQMPHKPINSRLSSEEQLAARGQAEAARLQSVANLRTHVLPGLRRPLHSLKLEWDSGCACSPQLLDGLCEALEVVAGSVQELTLSLGHHLRADGDSTQRTSIYTRLAQTLSGFTSLRSFTTSDRHCQVSALVSAVLPRVSTLDLWTGFGAIAERPQLFSRLTSLTARVPSSADPLHSPDAYAQFASMLHAVAEAQPVTNLRALCVLGCGRLSEDVLLDLAALSHPKLERLSLAGTAVESDDDYYDDDDSDDDALDDLSILLESIVDAGAPLHSLDLSAGGKGYRPARDLTPAEIDCINALLPSLTELILQDRELDDGGGAPQARSVLIDIFDGPGLDPAAVAAAPEGAVEEAAAAAAAAAEAAPQQQQPLQPLPPLQLQRLDLSGSDVGLKGLLHLCACLEAGRLAALTHLTLYPAFSEAAAGSMEQAWGRFWAALPAGAPRLRSLNLTGRFIRDFHYPGHRATDPVGRALLALLHSGSGSSGSSGSSSSGISSSSAAQALAFPSLQELSLGAQYSVATTTMLLMALAHAHGAGRLRQLRRLTVTLHAFNMYCCEFEPDQYVDCKQLAKTWRAIVPDVDMDFKFCEEKSQYY